MSLNQSRVERAEQHTRKSGRSSGPGHQRGFHNANAVKGGAGGAGSSAPPPPTSPSFSSSSASANRSFRKSNGQGAQPRVSNNTTNSEVNIGHGLQNGTLPHSQKPVVHFPGPSGKAIPDVAKQVDHSHPKNAQPPKVPASHSGGASSESASMASPSGVSSKMFPLQFGTITPGFVNGMQIPARTSSAPPNLDEQKRDQARHDSRPSPLPMAVAPKQQQKQQLQPPQVQQQQQQQQHPRRDLGPKVASVTEHNQPSQQRRDTTVLQIPVPSQTSSAKPAVLPLVGGSMSIPFQQSQVTTQYNTPNSQQSQSVSAGSLQMPLPLSVGNPTQVQQPLFVHGLQSHPLQTQGMIHQSQGLGYAPQLNHQLGPQLGNMGIGVAQFPQQTVNKFVTPRKAVKITDPKTHEELRLDKRTDSFTDTSSSGQTVQISRSHATVAAQPQQPIPSFSSYYSPIQPNSYTPSIFYAGQATHALANAQVVPGSSATRYGYPVSHGGPAVSVANSVALGTSLPQARSGQSSQATSDTINLEAVTAAAAPVQVTVKPPTASLSGKVGSSTSTPSGDSSSAKKGAVIQTEPAKGPRHQEPGFSNLQRSTEGARLISSAMGEILAQSSSTTVPSAAAADAGSRSCIEQPKPGSGMPSSPTLHASAAVISPASSAAIVEERKLSAVSSISPITVTEEPANISTNLEGRKWDPLKKSDSFKDQQKLNRKELQQSELENKVYNSAVKLKSSSVGPSKISEMDSEDGFRKDESKPGALDGTLTSTPLPSSLKLENSRPSEVAEVSETKDNKALSASSRKSITELEVKETPINSESTSSLPFDAVRVDAAADAVCPVKLSYSDPSEVVVTAAPERSVSGHQVPHDSGTRDEANRTSESEDSISKMPINKLENQELVNMPFVGCSGDIQITDSCLHQVPVIAKVEEVAVQVLNLKAEQEDTVGEASDYSLNHPSDEASGVEVAKEESLGFSAITSRTDSVESENLPSVHLSRGNYEKQNERESMMFIEDIESPAESTNSSRGSAAAVPEVTQKYESSRGSENLNTSVNPSILSSSRDKIPSEQSKPKNVSGRKKKKKELFSKADAAGTTADLYMAYKTPEEKQDIAVSENSNTMSSKIDGKQVPEGDRQKHASSKEEDSPNKSELDDWEEAAEISSPKLKTLEMSEDMHSKKFSAGHDSGSVGRKRYTRDFLMTFSEQCKDLPAGFGIGSDIADIIINVQVNASFIDRDMYHMGGRIFDRQPSGSSRLDRRGSGNMEDDRWNKLTASFVTGRTDLAYGIPGTGFRPGQGGNLGVLKNPRGQPGGQYVSGILSGPMQSLGSPGGMPRIHADVDRWQRATPVQKGLIPSPHAQSVVMHKAEKRYEVGKVSDEEQAKQRQLKSILNKLTPQNFEKLFGQVKEVNIDNVVTLTGVISQIFDKALMEPTFCEMYADFCSRLAGALPDLVEGNDKVTFRRLLLNKCQEEFERGENEEAEADKDGEEGEVKQSAEEREKRIKARRRMLGNIRLIGELYKKKMLTERIMHECIKKLLGQYDNPDEEDVEALCKLMSTIGAIIDHPIAKEHMDAYFDRMQMLSTNQNLSSRMRFMLRDTIDLRKNRWQQRRKVDGPKKIEEVHRDAAQERQAQSGRASRGSGMSSSARRGQAIDYGPRGSTGSSSPGSQPQGSLRGMPASARFGTQDVRMEDRHILESRTLSVPLPQRSIDDDSITLGPQGGLARGMSMRGHSSMSSGSANDISASTGDVRRMGMGLSASISPHSLADWAPHSSRDEVSSRGPLLDRPKSAHSYGQPSHEDRTSRDGRNTPVSSTGSHSSIDKLSEEQLREKSISAIREFYSANDEEEVTSCVKELNAPNFYSTMVSLWVTDSFERKTLERDRLTKLLISLCKSRNHLLSQVQLIKGFESVFATLSDAIYDAPKAPEFLGGILAKVILENIINFKDVGRLIYEGGEEPGSLTESGIASDVLGSILEIIKKEKGETVLKSISRNSEIRLEEFLPPDPRKQAKLIAFI